jgi:hypothetical protein
MRPNTGIKTQIRTRTPAVYRDDKFFRGKTDIKHSPDQAPDAGRLELTNSYKHYKINRISNGKEPEMKRYMVPRVSHCKSGCQRGS